jgi:hypothetical protein
MFKLYCEMLFPEVNVSIAYIVHTNVANLVLRIRDVYTGYRVWIANPDPWFRVKKILESRIRIRIK